MAEKPPVLSVADLTSQIKSCLEGNFSSVWVSGELSDLARPQSGHVYLTLKDKTSQIRAVMWRGVASKLPFKLEDGQEVICQGQVDVYPPRGSYQLIIRKIEPVGVGALQLAFQQLHAKLTEEGLFALEHKQSLPTFSRRIAFVTSPTGAAIRDFLEVARRRWKGVQVTVIPARVQGSEAAVEISRGLRLANQLVDPPDVIVVGRGGGSVEDLWCFNEEAVVRSIFMSRIPVVSAVGHEIDVTLSDLVADLRAATPTEAAELVVPSHEELQADLRRLRLQLTSALKNVAITARSRLTAISGNSIFRRPFDSIHELTRRLDELDSRQARAINGQMERFRECVRAEANRLDSLSPLAVLSRGYSVTTTAKNNQVVKQMDELSRGDVVRTRLEHGAFTSRVEEVEEFEEEE
ncbi:MAG: exodeoxyribonuclease VII large subunit [Pirellulaceae bacterium]|nr:exodeoxyribonuclease VII large subunit [Pirellulaceae bacterium]